MHDDLDPVTGSSSAGSESLQDSFQHLVVTRFNVRIPGYAAASDDWVRRRLVTFARIAVPAMKGQTTRAFRWLVLFDESTSVEARPEIVRLARGVFEPVFVRGDFTPEVAARTLSACVEPGASEYVVTTRVDNDDAVADTFVETVQAQVRTILRARVHRRFYVSLTSGCEVVAGRAYRRPYTKNPFISLVEPTGGELRTVFASGHFQIDEVAPGVEFRTRTPMWVQYIHGENLENRRVGLRMRSRLVQPYFSSDLALDSTDAGLVSDWLRNAAGIALRLVRKPSRVPQLVKAMTARVTS